MTRPKHVVAALTTCFTVPSDQPSADTMSATKSFPSELTKAYKKAYETKYTNDKVEILNQNMAAGMAYAREQTIGGRAEVFWASAQEAFEVLAANKLLHLVEYALHQSQQIVRPEGMG